MVNDPESGFGKEGGLVFENAGTEWNTTRDRHIDISNTTAPQLISKTSLPQPISDTDLQFDGGSFMYDCTVHTACLNGGTCYDNQCICSSGFSGIHCTAH